MNINMKPLLLTAAMVATGLSFTTAQAATVTDSMDVEITIVDACEIQTAPTKLDFGSHGILNANIDSTSIISVTCTNSAAYDIGLNGGGAGDIDMRVMTLGSEDVSYDLYSDAAGGLQWGDTVGTDTVAKVGTGIEQQFTVFGRVPSQTTPTAGVYTDTVTVTVTY